MHLHLIMWLWRAYIHVQYMQMCKCLLLYMKIIFWVQASYILGCYHACMLNVLVTYEVCLPNIVWSSGKLLMMHNTTIISFPGLSDFSHLCVHLTYTHVRAVAASQVSWVLIGPPFPSFMACLASPISAIAWQMPTQGHTHVRSWVRFVAVLYWQPSWQSVHVVLGVGLRWLRSMQ